MAICCIETTTSADAARIDFKAVGGGLKVEGLEVGGCWAAVGEANAGSGMELGHGAAGGRTTYSSANALSAGGGHGRDVEGCRACASGLPTWIVP